MGRTKPQKKPGPSPQTPAAPASLLGRLTGSIARTLKLLVELAQTEHIYAALSAVLVLITAETFFGSMRLQTEQVRLWFDPTALSDLTGGAQKLWSAPLDDVFIHFDFARSAAEGHPFEWTPGNGYSSGGTSLLYPFVLALGFLAGYQGLSLMHWAGIVACVSTFGLLLGARRMAQRLPPQAALLVPFCLLSTGVLNWTLFSGMEVALFLAVWALCLVLWDDLVTAILEGTQTRAQFFLLGIGGMFLVAGRPEAAPILALFGIWCAVLLAKKRRFGRALLSLIIIGAPGATVMIGHMVANKVFTGSTSAAGALAKLEMYHPYMTGEQVFGSWLHFLEYQFLRLSNYHFSTLPGPGFLIWPIALLSIVFQKTRRYGVVLWLSLVFWIALIALNGQVRWQNERYTMPAVAWLLLAAALGLGGALDFAFSGWKQARLGTGPSRRARLSLAIPVVLAAATFVTFQAGRYREQVWFFGRASRNILEQHVRAGQYLGHARKPKPQRILLSDAGAIPYAAGTPAFDLIGLGGYAGLPLAGASRQGVGAAIELLEHLPASTRPDVMALYPGWWGTFTLWFGTQVEEFPVRGNVICGGASKIIYEPDWSPLEHSAEPFALPKGAALVDSLDLADVLSEKAHAFALVPEKQGYVDMKMLPDPRNGSRELWDAGRLLSTNMVMTFQAAAGAKALYLRVAPSRPAKLLVVGNTGKEETVTLAPKDDWQEVAVPLALTAQGPLGATVTVRVLEGDVHLYHVFLTSTPIPKN